MGNAMNQPENLDSPTILLRRLHRWRMAFFGLVILIAGLTTGAASTLLVLHGRGPEPPGPPDRADLMMLERMMPRLHLTPEQAERVGPILRQHMDRLYEIREQGRQQIAKELQAMDEEMSGVLGPDQRQRWRDLMRELPGVFPRGAGRYGPGPKGPMGPRGGGRGQLRRGMDSPSATTSPLPEPNSAPGDR